MPFPFIVSCSYGNDSVALLQWMHETGWASLGCAVIYSDTGWARDTWPARVDRCEAWARDRGFACFRTYSIGFEALVRQRKGWPRQGMQFCTQVLKTGALLREQDRLDPERRAIIIIGKRREESRERAETPQHVDCDPYNGDRALWHPLYLHDEEARNGLLQRAGFEPLPHRSDECWPCINANKGDLRRLAEDTARVDTLRRLEADLGFTSKGKPLTMFRPYRYRGATGIDAMLRWAHTEHGGAFDDGTGTDCGFGRAGCGV